MKKEYECEWKNAKWQKRKNFTIEMKQENEMNVTKWCGETGTEYKKTKRHVCFRISVDAFNAIFSYSLY